MKTLSQQQRNYFIGRIKAKINKEINAIEHINATKIQKAGEKKYKEYLKATGLDKLLNEYMKYEKKWNDARENMELVCKELWEKTDYVGKDNYGPSTYNSSSVEKFLHQICNAIAKDTFVASTEGTRLRQLRDKKTKAVDIVMGMTETNEVVNAINKVLTDVNLQLGNGNGK